MKTLQEKYKNAKKKMDELITNRNIGINYELLVGDINCPMFENIEVVLLAHNNEIKIPFEKIGYYDEANEFAKTALDYIFDCSYAKISHKIKLEIINKDEIDYINKNCPNLFYKQMFNFAAIPYITLMINDMPCDIRITKSMLELWNKKQYEVFDDATSRITEKNIESVCINESTTFSGDENIFDIKKGVIIADQGMTTIRLDNNKYGAAIIYCPEILKQISEQIEQSYFILPSSKQELIIIPEMQNSYQEQDNKTVINTFSTFIKSVNETELLPNDVMSDIPFYYDIDREQLLSSKNMTMHELFDIMR